MALYAPVNVSIPLCDNLIVSYVEEVGFGATWIMVEEYMNQYLIRFRLSTERHHLKAAPCNASLR